VSSIGLGSYDDIIGHPHPLCGALRTLSQLSVPLVS
jgi:hypothetical protein